MHIVEFGVAFEAMKTYRSSTQSLTRYACEFTLAGASSNFYQSPVSGSARPLKLPWKPQDERKRPQLSVIRRCSCDVDWFAGALQRKDCLRPYVRVVHLRLPTMAAKASDFAHQTLLLDLQMPID